VLKGGATLAKRIERAGIPAAHVCAITLMALTVGTNRIVPGAKIGSPVRDVYLDLRQE